VKLIIQRMTLKPTLSGALELTPAQIKAMVVDQLFPNLLHTSCMVSLFGKVMLLVIVIPTVTQSFILIHLPTLIGLKTLSIQVVVELLMEHFS
jgi:hypothetical protein